MFNASIKLSFKLVLALIVIAGMSASSFAQSAVGTPNAGSAGAGDSAISGIPSGPANVDGINNAIGDPSGLQNAYKVAAPPPPSIGVPKIPQFQ
jgi:hypothetical protein